MPILPMMPKEDDMVEFKECVMYYVLCMKTYNLNPAHYFNALGFSFDFMLKYTEIKLELLTDYDMLLMFENDITDGLTQVV